MDIFCLFIYQGGGVDLMKPESRINQFIAKLKAKINKS